MEFNHTFLTCDIKQITNNLNVLTLSAVSWQFKEDILK